MQLLQQRAQRRVEPVTRDQELFALLGGIAEEASPSLRAIVALLDLCGQYRRHAESFAKPTLKDAKHITVDIQPGHIRDLKRPEERQPKAKAAAHHLVDCLR